MAKKPNIILIMCDQLRAFETGCYGNPVIRTPNIDRLSAEGIRFETAVTNYPVCMAARSVTLSGQYNRMATGGVGNVGGWLEGGGLYMPQYPVAGRPHLKDPTLVEILKNHGYDTSVIGKWHIHSWPDDLGFEEYLIPRVHHCHTGQLYTHNGSPEIVPEGFSVEFECEQVETFLKSRSGTEEPFFLFYSISPPHCPLSDAPDYYLSMYDPDIVPIRPNIDLSKPLPDQQHWFNVYRWDFRYYNLGLPYTLNLPADYDLRRVIAEYYGLTTWVDDMVGRVIQSLENLGLDENTIVIFTSDHGDYLGSHGRVQKGDLHEESIRIPWILHWSGGLSPAVIESQVASLVDIVPTVLGLLDLPVPAHVHGQDLSSLLWRRTGQNFRNYAIIETSLGAGIRTLDKMYGLNFVNGTRSLEEKPEYFFDLVNDPYQMKNLVNEIDQYDEVGLLKRSLQEWDANTPWMK